MPWQEMSAVEQRDRFIDDHRLGLYDMTELCARFATSRKTDCKWLARYNASGRPGCTTVVERSITVRGSVKLTVSAQASFAPDASVMTGMCA